MSGFQSVAAGLFSLFRITLVDEYAYDVSGMDILRLCIIFSGAVFLNYYFACCCLA